MANNYCQQISINNTGYAAGINFACDQPYFIYLLLMSVRTAARNHLPIIWKILFAFVLGCLAIWTSLAITRTTFRNMLAGVAELSRPHTELQLLHQIFREIVTLDQMQRNQVLQQTYTDDAPFLRQAGHIVSLLDSLAYLSRHQSSQLARIDSMKHILYERDRLFLSYLKLRKTLSQNDTLSEYLQWMSGQLGGIAGKMDSMIATERKITTTVIQPVDTVLPYTTPTPRQSLWQLLWGRKKEPAAVQMQKLITQELNITTDTITTLNKDSILQGITRVVTTAESARENRRTILIDRQLKLIAAGNVLVNQLSDLLKELEAEEQIRMMASSSAVAGTMQDGLKRLNLLVVIFVSGAALLVFLIFFDVFRINQYRKQLTAAKEEAEEASVAKQRFLAGMSHELRTPLQAVLGFSEQLKDKGAATPEEIGIIYDSSLYLLQTVNEILDYSRIAAGKYPLHVQPFEMYPLLEEVRKVIQIKAAEKELAFHVHANVEPGVWYLGDAFRLRQILYNLLGNAVKYTDHGTVSLHITGEDKDDRTLFDLVVADTGVGISAADRERIFNEFEQVQHVPDQGTGLGLSIVRELVAIHGGKITVDSTPGQGTRFHLQLSYPKTVSAEITPSSFPSGKPPDGMVWVVDDDAAIRKLCHVILEKNGIRHQIFASGAEVRAAPATADLRLVLLDIRMPGENGFEVFAALKKYISVPVVALTAQILPEEQQQIHAYGFGGILPKPFTAQKLLSLIYSMMAEETDTASAGLHLPDTIRKMWGGDPAAEQAVMAIFITETAHDISMIRRYMQQDEAEQVAELLHRLAGRLGQFDKKVEAHTARTLEIRLRETKDWEGVKAALPEWCAKILALLPENNW